MRTYAVDDKFRINENLKTDVVIVGMGVAGLYCAINLDSSLSCIILNKMGGEESNSIYAQGGIASICLEHDSFKSHYDDTIVAGAGLCDSEAVKVLVSEGPENINRLINLGVPFDRDENNNLCITKEGAHSCNRIVHCGGDATGYHLTHTLIDVVKKRKNIKILNEVNIVDIMKDKDDNVAGLITQDRTGSNTLIMSPCVVIASGGIGRIFRNSTNSLSATGDGLAACMRAGAQVNNMEFVQFHPTALIHPDNNMRYFLISEALRGEGAVLRNRKGERFMVHSHPMAELAPRDIVSRSIVAEMIKNDLPCVYLDITARGREFLKKRFPVIYDACLKKDIDIAVNWIPVIPVQHYFMGGVSTNLFGRTSVNGLYAVGESAYTGVHGANRLASNSLLECLVFGRRSAIDINNRNLTYTKPQFNPVAKTAMVNDYQTYSSRIRNLMTKKGGIIRNAEGLKEAINEIEQYYDRLNNSSLISWNEIEVLNMSTVALEILKAALKRERSIGAHYRSDSE